MSGEPGAVPGDDTGDKIKQGAREPEKVEEARPEPKRPVRTYPPRPKR